MLAISDLISTSFYLHLEPTVHARILSITAFLNTRINFFTHMFVRYHVIVIVLSCVVLLAAILMILIIFSMYFNPMTINASHIVICRRFNLRVAAAILFNKSINQSIIH